MRTTTRRFRGQRGFTLAELLITTAIVGLVMSGLWVMLSSGQESYLVGASQAEAQQSIRLAVDRMVNELRNAGYCPTCATSCADPPLPGESGRFAAISAASATSFTIWNDWNGDYICASGTGINTAGTVNYVGTATQRGEQITYDVTGTDLRRREFGVDGAPVVIAAGISAATFTYLDAAGATVAVPCTLTTCRTIRRVVITLTAQPQFQPAATQQGRAQVTVQDTVRLRNR